MAAGKAAEAISAHVTNLIALGLKTMFLNKLRLTSIALLFFGAAAATTVGVLAQSGARSRPMPLDQNNGAVPVNLPPDRRPDSTATPVPGSAPPYITQSRAMIVTRLEEELAEAQVRLDRTLNKVRSPDDPAAAHARKTVDALEQVLARIDAVLVDAVEAYPTMFDFSGGPAADSAKNQSADRPAGGMMGAIQQHRAPVLLEADLAEARKRLKWAEDQFKRGYIAKSVVDQERQNVRPTDL